MTKITLKIKDMHCPNCAMRIEGIEDELLGVKSANCSYRKQTLVVEFDENLTDRVAIINRVKEIGYTAE
jgi:Cu+-exporting ATPase